MEKKKVNLFHVETTYQLITALNIILDRYLPACYSNIVYVKCKKHGGFNPDLVANFKNIIFKKYLKEDIKDHINDILFINPDRFYFFQELNMINKYLAYKFKKRGARIILGPDGTKVYAKYRKSHEFLSMIKDTFKDYKSLILKGIFLSRIFWSKYYRYGSFRYLDEVLIQYLELFDAHHNNTIGELKLLPDLTADRVNKISSVLKLKLKSDIELERTVFYFNQPLWSEETISREIEIIRMLSKKAKSISKRLYIKIHPSTSDIVIEKISQIDNIDIIKDNIAAEFYIARSNNSTFVTGWSTCLMHPMNDCNRYYYTYPMFKDIDDNVLNQLHLIPFPHIKSVTTIDEIEINH